MCEGVNGYKLPGTSRGAVEAGLGLLGPKQQEKTRTTALKVTNITVKVSYNPRFLFAV